jgi:hypothetical protein
MHTEFGGNILGNSYLEDWDENDREFQNFILRGIGYEDLNGLK